jgi:hypothetical protein
MDIELSIEQLILHGIDLPRGQRSLLRAAVEGELTRLLSEGGLASRLADGEVQPHLPGGEISLPPGGSSTDPVQLGVQIAQVVYGGINQ